MMLGKTEVRPNRPRDGRHCDLCGCSQPAVRCDKCGCQIFCLSCDDMYHRHPKRRFHLRKAVDPTPATSQARPVLPMKVAHMPTSPGDPSKMPLPPPRKKKPAKSFFDTFRRRSPPSDNSPPLPKKEYSWTDRLGNIKKFMSNRPLPPLPTTNGNEDNEMQQNSQSSKLSFIHKRVDDRPPQLPQRSLKPNEFSREKENIPRRLSGNDIENMRNGSMHPSQMNQNRGFSSPDEENNWDHRRMGNGQMNTLNRQNQQGFFPHGGPGFPGTLTNNMHQSASATDLQNLNNMEGYPGQGMVPPHYPHYPMNPHMPHFPYPMYPPQYPNYPQYFGNSFANLASQPNTTDGDISDQSESSSRHHPGRKYPFRKRAKRSQSVMVDRMAFPGQFYPFGPFPPGYGPGPWGQPFPMEAPPSPASSVRSLNRVGRTRRRKKMTSDDEEEFDVSSSPLSRTKSSSSERPPPAQRLAPLATQTTSEDESEEEKERERNRNRTERQPSRRGSDPNKQSTRRESDPRKIQSPVSKSPQVHHKKIPKQKQQETLKQSDSEELPPSPIKIDRQSSRDSNTDQPDQDLTSANYIPSSQWQCKHCTFINSPGNRICQVCCKTASVEGVTLMTSRPNSASTSSRKQSLSSEQSCSSPEKKMEEEDTTNTKRDHQDMEVLNTALDEAEKEISRGLKELMKLKEDFLPEKSSTETHRIKPNETSPKVEENAPQGKPVYKSSGKMRTSILDKLNLQSNKQPAKSSTASTSTETQTGPNSKTDRIIEARSPSTSSNASDAYNSPTAQSPQFERATAGRQSNSGNNQSTTRKEMSCQTQTDDLLDYLERKKAEEEAYFGRPNAFRYGDIMDPVTSPVPGMYDRGFGGGFGMMQRSHSRASLFTGRLNDLGHMDYPLGPTPMYRSVSRSSLTGDFSENRLSEFHNLRKPDYYLSMEELVERRRQESIRAQGLELVRMIREAEQQGFTADDIQVALSNCGNQNPLEWLQDNWRNVVDNVITLCNSYANDKKENDIGTVSETEAREALRMHKGNVWAAVTECVESRQRKFLELKARGKFSSKDITDILTSSQGDVEMAYAKLTKSTSKPFLMRIWGAGEGVANQDGAMPLMNETFKSSRDRFETHDVDREDVLSDEIWDEEEEDVEWGEDSEEPDEDEELDELEDLQTCRDDGCISDEIKTPESCDESEYCDAFGSNTLERNISSPGSDTFFVIPDIKKERKGTSFLSKLAAFRKEDKGSKQKQSTFYDEDSKASYPEDQKAKEDTNDDSASLADQSKSHGPLKVIKNTISAIRDSVNGSKSEKKLPCAAPERRTIIVKGQIEHESLSKDPDKVKLTSVKPLKADLMAESNATNETSLDQEAKSSLRNKTIEISETKLAASERSVTETKKEENSLLNTTKDDSSPSSQKVPATSSEIDSITTKVQIPPSENQTKLKRSQSSTNSENKEDILKSSKASSSLEFPRSAKNNSVLSKSIDQNVVKLKLVEIVRDSANNIDTQLKLKETVVAPLNKDQPQKTAQSPTEVSTDIVPVEKNEVPSSNATEINTNAKSEKASGKTSEINTTNEQNENNSVSQAKKQEIVQNKLGQNTMDETFISIDKTGDKANEMNRKPDLLDQSLKPNKIEKRDLDPSFTSSNTNSDSDNIIKIISPTNAINETKCSDSPDIIQNISNIVNHSNQSQHELSIIKKSDSQQGTQKVESATQNSIMSKSNQNSILASKSPSESDLRNSSQERKEERNAEQIVTTAIKQNTNSSFSSEDVANSLKPEQLSPNTQDNFQRSVNKLGETVVVSSAKINRYEVYPVQSPKLLSEITKDITSNKNEDNPSCVKYQSTNQKDDFTEHAPVKAIIKEINSRPTLEADVVSDSINIVKTENKAKDLENIENSSKVNSNEASTLSNISVDTSEEIKSSEHFIGKFDQENSLPQYTEELITPFPNRVDIHGIDANDTPKTPTVNAHAKTVDENDAKHALLIEKKDKDDRKNEIPIKEDMLGSKIPVIDDITPKAEKSTTKTIEELPRVTNEISFQSETADPVPESSPGTTSKPKKKILKKSKKELTLNSISETDSSPPEIKEISSSSTAIDNGEINNKTQEKILETRAELIENSPSISGKSLFEIPLVSSESTEQSATVQASEVIPVSSTETREQNETEFVELSSENSELIIESNEQKHETSVVRTGVILTTPDDSSTASIKHVPETNFTVLNKPTELTITSTDEQSVAIDKTAEQNMTSPEQSTTGPELLAKPITNSDTRYSNEAESTIPLDAQTTPPSAISSASQSNSESKLQSIVNQSSESSPSTNGNQQHSEYSIEIENNVVSGTLGSTFLPSEPPAAAPDNSVQTSLVPEKIINIANNNEKESEDEESSDESIGIPITPPNPVDTLRHRFEGLIDANSTGIIRPQSPYRRMSFRSTKAAIALERTRDISVEKPWFIPKPVIEPKKPAPKRSLKQQLDIERRVRKMVADRKCRTYRKAEIIVQLIDMNFEEEEAIQAANDCSTLEQAISYLQQECLLCTACFPVSYIISMVHCSHKACKECLRAYFTVQIRDRNIMELLCPFCNEPDIFDEDIAQDYFNHLDIMLKKLVDPEIHELFQRKLRDRVLMRDPNFKWCSQCSSGFIAMPNLKRLVCPDCNAVTCASCRRPWEKEHQGISCEAFAAWKDAADPEAQTVGLAKLLTEDGIDCPRCHFRYALAKGGCMHFRCTQCQHDFCSGCSKPFKMGQKCGVSEFCAKLGLHAHHPRNCLFYLRDKEPEDLQRLLELNNIKYDKDPPDGVIDKSTCQVMEQKETADGMVDDYCGKDVEDGFAGLCRVHYVEYLGQLVNKHKVDPIQIFENDDLELVLKRANIRLPPKRYRESDAQYRDKLVDLINEELPLDRVEGS